MASTQDIDDAVTKLLTAASKQFSSQQTRLIGIAAYTAVKAHDGQKRKTNEPYVMHPIRVTTQLLTLRDDRVDVSCVCAALLHDVLEDTTLKKDKITALFGRDVLTLVQALTEPEGIKDKIERDHAYHTQVLEKTKRDARVGIIKLCDVLDNARTLEVYSDLRQKQKIEHITEIFIPLAKQLKLHTIQQELKQEVQKRVKE